MKVLEGLHPPKPSSFSVAADSERRKELRQLYDLFLEPALALQSDDVRMLLLSAASPAAAPVGAGIAASGAALCVALCEEMVGCLFPVFRKSFESGTRWLIFFRTRSCTSWYGHHPLVARLHVIGWLASMLLSN